MSKTIYVRKLYADDGKFGKEYKIYSTSGLYYTSKKPFESFVEEGASLEVEAEPTKNPKYFKLKSCTLIPQAPSTGTDQPKAGQGRPLVAVPSLPLPKLTPDVQAEWIRRGMEAMDMAFGKDASGHGDWDPMAYSVVLAELVHEWYGEYVGQQMKARLGK